MWVHSCIITANDVAYSFFSVAPVRQQFKGVTTAIFIVALIGMYQQLRGQILGLWGEKMHFRGYNVCYHMFNISSNMTNASLNVP